MAKAEKLLISTPGDLEIAFTRVFDAPRTLVFDAHTKPELIRRWLLGPSGWSMPVCEVDLKVGGSFRYVWKHEDGRSMGMGGVYREIVRPARLVATEAFDEPWHPGGVLDTLTLVEKGGKTTLTQTMHYDSKEIRDIVFKGPMKDGMGAGYERLEKVLQEEAR